MKWITRCLMLTVLASMGCVTLPLWDEKKPNPEPAPAVEFKPTVPSVTAEQITEENCFEKARALREEMDRESEDVSPPATAPTKK